MQRLQSFVLLCAIATLWGCAHHRTPPLPPAPPVVEYEACSPEAHFAFLEPDSAIYRQGAVIGIKPMADVSPAGTRLLPLDCTSDWTVTGPARLSADRTRLTIDPDADVDSEIVLSFRYRAEPVVSRFRVVARDAIVLTGTWSQQKVENCEALEPVREIIFSPQGRFAVTFRPFETYKDYWGTYVYEPETGALRLSVEEGNYVPDGLDLEGRADLADGRLTLRDMYLGLPIGIAPATGCTYIF